MDTALSVSILEKSGILLVALNFVGCSHKNNNRIVYQLDIERISRIETTLVYQIYALPGVIVVLIRQVITQWMFNPRTEDLP